MNKINRRLLTILGIGWLGFAITGIVIGQVFAAPNFVLLIDRSYCSPQQWQTVVKTYTDLYRQHQQQQLQIESVVLFSDLGEDRLESLPTPEQISQIRTYGRFNPQRQTEVTKTYPKGKVLSCQDIGM